MLNLIHPPAVDGRDMHPEPRMSSQPGSGELRSWMLSLSQRHVDERDRYRRRAIDGVPGIVGNGAAKLLSVEISDNAFADSRRCRP